MVAQETSAAANGHETSKKPIPRLSQPPTDGGSYVIPQLEGEVISIPGSKSVFRVLTSAVQTDDAFSVFSSGGVLADAPGFHHHNEAHDIFIVTKGFVKIWSGDRCKVLGPGDFASVPPGVIHNPQTLGPYTETFGLITPGPWIDFFRYISETYSGILFPESDNRDLASILIPKVMAAKGKFDVVFHPHHTGAEVSEWDSEDEKLPSDTSPFYLRANTGPRWILGGVLSRPFITTKQSAGKFAISSIESSDRYPVNPLQGISLTFPGVHHCFTVFEGTLEVMVGGHEACAIREGETLFVPAGVSFSFAFKSKYVRFWSFASGDGVEAVVHEAGKEWGGIVLPDEAAEWEEGKVREVCEKLGVTVE